MWKAFDHEIKRERRKNGTIEELFLSSVPPQTEKEKDRSEKQMDVSPEKSAGREQTLSSRKLSVNHFLIIRHKTRETHCVWF